MTKMRTGLLAILLTFAMTVLGAGMAQGFCIEYPDTWCDYQCEYVGSWGFFCNDPADRCCWESGTGNTCGDSSSCDECDCEEFGGF